MLCPMKLRKLNTNEHECVQSVECAWWTKTEEDQGYCAITRLAINTDIQNAEVKVRQ